MLALAFSFVFTGLGQLYNGGKLRALPFPVVAAVNGVAAGAGANVALGCDIVLAGRYSEWEYYNSDHAFLAGKKAAEKVKPMGLREVNVFVKGVGGGRESAIRALNANGINVLTIKDVTPIPHNGCRAPKPRRV